MWWSNNDQRKFEKERIKHIIKDTKLAEKAQQQGSLQLSVNTPPGLCHSIPTSDSYSSERTTRQASLESQFSPEFGYNGFVAQDLFSSSMMPPPQFVPSMGPYVPELPFEVDVKTETQTYVNDIQTRRDSTISSFSTFPGASQSGFPEDAHVSQQFFEERIEQFTEEPFDFNFFDFQHDQLSPQHNAMIQVEAGDKYLLDHFMNSVVPILFPILETNKPGSAWTDIVAPALQSNPTYLHCCLSAAALHYKLTTGEQSEQLDTDIMHHRMQTVSQLCTALGNDINYEQTLEATLAIITFQSAISGNDDSLKDIAWHQHFECAKDLILKLQLPYKMLSNQTAQPPFNMTLAAWTDILGATMKGRAPLFADTYREKIAHSSMGLAELMGCEDKIMFVISEIACLEAMKIEKQMDEVSLCTYIRMLGEQITMTEQGPALENVYRGTGAIRPKQLSKNITHIYRIAARIYLCSLVPDFDPSGQHVVQLVSSLASAMEFIPAGPEGYDRSLVWPLLIAGSVAMADSPFRAMFATRSKALGQSASFGSYGRVAELLKLVWAVNDERAANGDRRCFHWREAMEQNGWDFLLI